MQSSVFEKYSYKKYLIITIRSKSDKIIFESSYNIIVVDMRLIFIYIGYFEFGALFYKFFCFPMIILILLVSLVYKNFYLQDYFEDLLKIILSILENLRNSKAKSVIKNSRSRKICYRFVKDF